MLQAFECGRRSVENTSAMVKVCVSLRNNDEVEIRDSLGSMTWLRNAEANTG